MSIGTKEETEDVEYYLAISRKDYEEGSYYTLNEVMEMSDKC